MIATVPSRGRAKTVRPERTPRGRLAALGDPARARVGLPERISAGATSTTHSSADRRQPVPEERLLAAGEQPDRGEHHRAEDHQREHVDQRLGHDRAEHRRQAVARAAEAARDDERARRLAEPRRQRRRHQHADRRALDGIHHPRPGVGQRGLQDRVPGDGAQQHRGAHQRQPEQHPRRARAHQRVADPREPDVLDGEHGARDDRREPAAPTQPAAQRGLPRPRARGIERGSRRAGTRGCPSAGSDADPHRGAARRALRRRDRERVLVRRPRPARPRAARRSAPRCAAAPAASRSTRAGSSARSRSVSASAVASPRGTSSAVDARRSPRRDSRRCPRPRPACPAAKASVSTIPNDSPPSEGAHSTIGGAQRALLAASSSTRPSARHALGLDEQRRQLVRGQPDDRQLGGNLPAQRLERAQQHRQALALDGLADERDPQRLAGRPHARRRHAARRAARRRSGSRGSARRRSAGRSRPPPRRPRSARAGG